MQAFFWCFFHRQHHETDPSKCGFFFSFLAFFFLFFFFFGYKDLVSLHFILQTISMAIIKELGLEVKILIGGKAVKEYPDTEPDLQDLELGPNTKTSHCYIECQENMEFGIQCKVHAGKSPAARWAKKKEQLMIFAPSFDGGPYLQNLCIDEPGESRIDDGIVDFGDDTFRKFRFSKVSTGKSFRKCQTVQLALLTSTQWKSQRSEMWQRIWRLQSISVYFALGYGEVVKYRKQAMRTTRIPLNSMRALKSMSTA